MTKEETIKVLQSIEDRAVDFPYMTACDWVAIAAAKRHLSDDKIEEVDLEKELSNYIEHYRNRETGYTLFGIAKHFFELGIRSKVPKASEFLKKHFEETPQKELDKEWKEIESLNDIGPDVLEYADKVKKSI